MAKQGYSLLIRFLVLLFLGGILIPPICPASSVAPLSLTLTQPDGSTIQGIPRGGEAAHWTETPDGYSIVKSKGRWEYATAAPDGKLVGSGHPVRGEVSSELTPRGKKQHPEWRSLGLPPGLAKHIRPAINSDFDYQGAPVRVLRSTGTTAVSGSLTAQGRVIQVDGTVTQPLLVLLVSFSDIGFQYSQNQFSSLFFGDTGSARDFFASNSGGHFLLSPAVETRGIANDGIIPVNLGYAHPNPQDAIISDSLLNDILSTASPFIDFAFYDSNEDGEVTPSELGICLILAGYETAYGGENVALEPSVWGHASWGRTLGGPSATFDGVFLTGYFAQGERHATSILDSHMTTLGIVAHELGHLLLQLPDLYDTDGSSAGIGDWGLMASGNWNALSGYAGSTPAMLSAYSRVATGFVPANDVVAYGADVVIQPDQPHRIWLDPYHGGEHFLLEARRRSGYDAALPGEGLLIWHIDPARPGNSDETHKLVDLEEADGSAHLDSYANSGDPGDPFPGNDARYHFTDSTVPNTRDYGNSVTGVAVSNIDGSSIAPGVLADLDPGMVPNGATLGYDEGGYAGWAAGLSSSTAYTAVRFTNDTGRSQVDGVELYAGRSGNINLSLYESMNGSVPNSLLYSETGRSVVAGWNRIFLTTPQEFPTGTDRVLVLRISTPGTNYPVFLDLDGPVSNRCYLSNVGNTYSLQTDGDFNQRLLLSMNDNIPPVISGCPAEISMEAEAGQFYASVSWTVPSALDDIDGPVSAVVSSIPDIGPLDPSGTEFPIGVTTISYDFTDNSGNSSVCSFDVSVGTRVVSDFSESDTPKALTDNGTTTSLLTIPNGACGSLIDLNISMQVTHSYVGDLIISLQHSSGRSATLINRQCGAGDNINANFDDESVATTQCGTSAPIISGTYRPLNPLNIFDGLDASGSWVLSLQDAVAGDTGTLTGWGLHLDCLAVADATPRQFEFLDQIDIPLDTVVLSNGIVVTGINVEAAVSISGGEYKVNEGSFTSVAGPVKNNDVVTVRVTSSAEYDTTASAVLTIGGVSDSFDVTTLAAPDAVPNPFSFTDQSDVPLGTEITSEPIFVRGINMPAQISVSGGAYSVNGEGFTTDVGDVVEGDAVSLRLTSAASYDTTTNASLTIGGVTDSFDVTTLPDLTPFIHFSNYPPTAYDTVQDGAGTVNIEYFDVALRLTGNRWQKIDFPYVVTPNTILEFDFRSARIGEVHAIGLDDNLNVDLQKTFQLYGTQLWGVQDFNHYAGGGETTHVVIPVGDYFTGNMQYLFFGMDHDVLNPTGESVFSKIRLYEAGVPGNISPVAMDDSTTVNEGSPSANLHAFLLANDSDEDGDSLEIRGVNTVGTVGFVTFDDVSDNVFYDPAGRFEYLAEGATLEDRFVYMVNDGRGGSDTGTVAVTIIGVNDAPTLTNPIPDQSATVGTGFSYQIPVGTFADIDNDDDGASLVFEATYLSGEALPGWLAFSAENRTFSKVAGSGVAGELTIKVTVTDSHGAVASDDFHLIVSDSPPGVIDFRNFATGQYGGQDVTGTALVEDGGVTLHLVGNRWKQIGLPYVVTVDTMLEFDFRSAAQGEYHAIGLDEDLTYSSNRVFKLWGTQNGYHIPAFTERYVGGNVVQHFVIPVGQYFAGNMNYLHFGMDHDVANPTGESVFSNVRLYENSPVLPEPPVIVSSAGTTATAGIPYQYDSDNLVEATGDVPITFSLLSGPSGMSVSSAGFVSWTPTVGQQGDQSVSIGASNPGGNDMQNFIISVVLPNNDPPTITSSAGTSVTEGSTYSYTPTVSDPDGPTVIWGVGASDTCGGNFSAGTYIFTPGDAPPVTCVVAVNVCDGHPINEQCSVDQETMVAITPVNDPPMISSLAATSVSEGATYSYTPAVSDPDGPSTLWSVGAGDTCGGSFSTGTYSFTAGAGPDSCVVAVQVCDGHAGDPQCSGVQQTTVSITEFNDPPTITSSAGTSVTEGSTYSYTPTASDPDGPSTLWSVGGADSCGGSFAAGTYSFTPGDNPPAICVVAAQVCDGHPTDAKCSAVQETTVAITAVNDPPVIASSAETEATEGVAYSYTPTVFDPDGPSTLWSVGGTDSCGGSFSAGSYSFTPGDNPPASCVVAVQVCDGHAGDPQCSAVQETTVDITPSDTTYLNFNDYTIGPYGGQDVTGTMTIEDGGAKLHLVGNRWKQISYPYVVTVNTFLEFDFRSSSQGEYHAIGLDEDLTYSSARVFKLWGTQNGYHITAYTGRYSGGNLVQHFVIPVGQYFTGAMNYLHFGMDHDVSNPIGEGVFSNVRLYEDTPVITPPVIVSIASLTAMVGVSYGYDANRMVEAEGSAPITFSLDSGPAGMTVSPNGLVSWIPTSGQTGGQPVVVRATNSAGYDLQSFLVTVVDQELSPTIVSLPRATAAVGAAYEYDDDQLVDANGSGEISFRLLDGPPRMTVSVAGLVTWIPVDGETGVQTVSIEASNSTGVDIQDFNIMVLPAPVEGSVRFDQQPVARYGTKNVGTVEILNSGQTLKLQGNIWRQISYSYVVTPDTVLEFDFQSTTEGELHAVGLDNDTSWSTEKTFKVYGSQVWGLTAYDNYAGGSAVQHYVLPVGQYFPGTMSHLFFGMDDDAHAAGDGWFSNVRIYEAD